MPKRVVPASKSGRGKKPTPAPPPPGPVDDMEGFDEGPVATQVAVAEQPLHDDLFEEPGPAGDDPMPSQDINSIPRPQPAPAVQIKIPAQPGRQVLTPDQVKRGAKGGKFPANPIRSDKPFGTGSILNGKPYASCSRPFAEQIFARVKRKLAAHGSMNTRAHSKVDVRNAFLAVMGEGFENKEYFEDLVIQFYKVHNILREK